MSFVRTLIVNSDTKHSSLLQTAPYRHPELIHGELSFGGDYYLSKHAAWNDGAILAQSYHGTTTQLGESRIILN